MKHNNLFGLGRHPNPDISDILQRFLTYYPEEIDLSLDRIKRLLLALNNPHKKISNIIHIAGTNGKGSVASFLAAILIKAGKKVSLYRSPHLVRFNERISINGKDISDEFLLEVLKIVDKSNNRNKITFFELITAAAFKAFSMIKSDITILEVGLGGKLDATNVIEKPLISIITPIGIDHTDFLGKSIRKITSQKIGIIKKNTPVLVGKQSLLVNNMIKDYALKLKCKSYFYGKDWKVKKNTFCHNNSKIIIDDCGLEGIHQIDNSSLAIMSTLTIPQLKVSREDILEGIKNVKWKGRLEKLKGRISHKYKNIEIWIDSAHNVLGFKVLNYWLKKNSDIKLIILAIGKKKDAINIINEISKSNPELIILNKDYNNFHDNKYLRKLIEKKGIKTKTFDNVFDSLKYCNYKYKKKKILITGSIYFIGQILYANN